MVYCLDTNTCIDAMRGKTSGLAERFRRHVPEDIGVSAMVWAELLLGARKTRDSEKTARIVQAFLAPYAVLPFDKRAAEHYAAIRHDLERTGRIIGPNDLVIAAIARARNLKLVTHNINEFGRVAGLMVEDWTAA
jgi:tRNA(fMet)-specific endonuclease VapC